MTHRESGRYYDGFLDWKGPKSKGWQKVWVLLQHTTLYFYENRIVGTMRGTDQPIPIAGVNLDGKITVEIEKKEPSKFTVKATTGVHKFKAYKPGDVDIWRAYIISFSRRSIPQEINQIILPGPRNDIIKALEEEFSLGPSTLESAPPVPTTSRPKRTGSQGSTISTGSDSSIDRRLSMLSISSTGSNASTDKRGSQKSQNVDLSPPEYRFYPDYLKELEEQQTWFFKRISRREAEEVLWNNRDKGDLLIRHSESQKNVFVISARLYIGPDQQEIRHYRINREGDLLVLDIDKQHPPILNLYEMLNYFIDQSGGPPRLRPLMTNDLKQLKLPQHLYERGFITRVDQDLDSGEWGPKPVPRDVLDQVDYIDPVGHHNKVKVSPLHSHPSPVIDHQTSSTEPIQQFQSSALLDIGRKQPSSQSPDALPQPDYINQCGTSQQLSQNTRGIQQIIPRPHVNLGTMGGQRLAPQDVTGTPSRGSPETYYNVDAIKKSRLSESAKHGSDQVYMNQPPIPARTESPIYCTPPEPPPIKTIPSQKEQTLPSSSAMSTLNSVSSQPISIPRPKLNPNEDSLKQQAQVNKTVAMKEELRKHLAKRNKPD